MRKLWDVALPLIAFALFFSAGFALKAKIDRAAIAFSIEDTMLPLGIIPAGQPLPDWAAKYSRGVTAAMDLVGEIDTHSGMVTIKPLRRLAPFCGGYLDPLDPSPENRFIRCPAMLNVAAGGELDGVVLDYGRLDTSRLDTSAGW